MITKDTVPTIREQIINAYYNGDMVRSLGFSGQAGDARIRLSAIGEIVSAAEKAIADIKEYADEVRGDWSDFDGRANRNILENFLVSLVEAIKSATSGDGKVDNCADVNAECNAIVKGMNSEFTKTDCQPQPTPEKETSKQCKTCGTTETATWYKWNECNECHCRSFNPPLKKIIDDAVEFMEKHSGPFKPAEDVKAAYPMPTLPQRLDHDLPTTTYEHEFMNQVRDCVADLRKRVERMEKLYPAPRHLKQSSAYLDNPSTDITEAEFDLCQQILEAKDLFQWLLDHGVGAMQGMTAEKLDEIKGVVR